MMQGKRHMKLKDSGFTLVELILVIGVLAIVATIGAPRLHDQLTNLKIKATARDIYSAFQQAKLEAVEENETVVLLFSQGTFSPEGGVGGYRLFMDDGAGGGTAGNLIQDGSESSLMTFSMPKKVSLISAAFTDGTDTKEGVGFTGRGLPADSFSGNVEVRTRNRWYRIELSVAGNIKMQKSADGVNWS